eukprot:12423284-Karenia_brevis.AAC.1
MAKRFDNMITAALCHIIQHDGTLPPSAHSLMQLPLKEGGLSMRSLQDTAPLAFVSSWALCLHRVLQNPGVSPLFLDLPSSAAGIQLRNALHVTNSTLFSHVPSARPVDWRDWTSGPFNKLQKLFTAKLDSILLQAWTREASPQDIARRLNHSSTIA